MCFCLLRENVLIAFLMIGFWFSWPELGLGILGESIACGVSPSVVCVCVCVCVSALVRIVVCVFVYFVRTF